MTQSTIITYLKAHGITFRKTHGCIYADSVCVTADGKTITTYVLMDWFTRRELLTWLGY